MAYFNSKALEISNIKKKIINYFIIIINKSDITVYSRIVVDFSKSEQVQLTNLLLNELSTNTWVYQNISRFIL